MLAQWLSLYSFSVYVHYYYGNIIVLFLHKKKQLLCHIFRVTYNCLMRHSADDQLLLCVGGHCGAERLGTVGISVDLDYLAHHVLIHLHFYNLDKQNDILLSWRKEVHFKTELCLLCPRFPCLWHIEKSHDGHPPD